MKKQKRRVYVIRRVHLITKDYKQEWVFNNDFRMPTRVISEHISKDKHSVQVVQVKGLIEVKDIPADNIQRSYVRVLFTNISSMQLFLIQIRKQRQYREFAGVLRGVEFPIVYDF